MTTTLSMAALSLLALLLFVLSLVSICDAAPSDPTPPLQLATSSAPFSTRSNPQLATLNGRVYLQGGINSHAGVTYGDSWVSGDGGVTWVQVPGTGLPVRYSGALVNLPTSQSDVQLYLLGGADNCCTYNDVHFSTDGLTFSLVRQADFSSRQSFAYAVAASLTTAATTVFAPAKPAIFVVGGYGVARSGGASSALNDVWYSVGSGSTVQFVAATMTAPWAPRAWHQVVAVQDSSRLILTGGTSSLYGGPYWFNDVWISDVGGAHWRQLTAAASFSTRAYFGMINVQEQLFVFAGRNSSISVNPAAAQTGDFNDLWSSVDYGLSFQQSVVSADFTPRSRISAVAVGRNVLVAGGDQGDLRVFSGALFVQPLIAVPILPTPASSSSSTAVAFSNSTASSSSSSSSSLSSGGAAVVVGSGSSAGSSSSAAPNSAADRSSSSTSSSAGAAVSTDAPSSSSSSSTASALEPQPVNTAPPTQQTNNNNNALHNDAPRVALAGMVSMAITLLCALMVL